MLTEAKYTTIEIKKHSSNPYWQKWKRGRPSIEARRVRSLYEIWNQKHRELYPEMYRSFLSDLLSHPTNHVSFNCNGKVVVKYIQRGR